MRARHFPWLLLLSGWLWYFRWEILVEDFWLLLICLLPRGLSKLDYKSRLDTDKDGQKMLNVCRSGYIRWTITNSGTKYSIVYSSACRIVQNFWWSSLSRWGSSLFSTTGLHVLIWILKQQDDIKWDMTWSYARALSHGVRNPRERSCAATIAIILYALTTTPLFIRPHPSLIKGKRFQVQEGTFFLPLHGSRFPESS
jgi:hypothetical protein